MYATLDDWIARETVPFSLESPGAFNNAIDAVMSRLGDSIDLLGFGEGLHGGSDILRFRSRLFQRLVDAHGYSAIAIESSFPRARAVNEYIAGRGAASFEAVQETGFSHGFGKLESSRELVEWMRQYNADLSHTTKLHFYGFDSPTEMVGSDSPRQLLYFALDYLTTFDSSDMQGRRERIDALLGDDASWENPAASFDPKLSIGLSPEATALRIETEELMSRLHVGRPALVRQSGPKSYQEAVHYASVARQLLNYHAALARESGDRIAHLLGIRDAMMADNLAYMTACERGRGKVLAFAHNNHLQQGMTEWQLGPHHLRWWPAGAHLSVMLNYAVIGSGVGASEANGIGQPEAGSLEARLAAVPGPGRFVPTFRSVGLPQEEIEALPARAGSTRNSTYFPLTGKSLTDFDWLVVLDSTGYEQGAPPLQQ